MWYQLNDNNGNMAHPCHRYYYYRYTLLLLLLLFGWNSKKYQFMAHGIMAITVVRLHYSYDKTDTEHRVHTHSSKFGWSMYGTFSGASVYVYSTWYGTTKRHGQPLTSACHVTLMHVYINQVRYHYYHRFSLDNGKPLQNMHAFNRSPHQNDRQTNRLIRYEDWKWRFSFLQNGKLYLKNIIIITITIIIIDAIVININRWDLRKCR